MNSQVIQSRKAAMEKANQDLKDANATLTMLLAIDGVAASRPDLRLWQLRQQLYLYPLLGVMFIWETKEFLGRVPRLRIPTVWRRRLEPIVLGLFVAACLYFRGAGSAFIYFQF